MILAQQKQHDQKTQGPQEAALTATYTEQVSPFLLHKIKAFSVQRLLFGMKILMPLHKHCTIPRAKYLLSSEISIESTATWHSQSQTCLDTGPNSAALYLIYNEQWSECAYAFQLDDVL